jgi:hypothetical protein
MNPDRVFVVSLLKVRPSTVILTEEESPGSKVRESGSIMIPSAALVARSLE